MEIFIRDVSHFVRKALKWTNGGMSPVSFRGQAFTGWKTLPKIFRTEVGLYDYEKNAVRDLISLHPQEFRDDQTMFDRLVRMQHFDLPTRLLDVTTNPLVALYFASEKYTDADGIERDGKVQAFFLPDTRQKYFDSDLVSCMTNLCNLTSDEKQKLQNSLKFEKEKFNDIDEVKRLVSFVQIEKSHFKPEIVPEDLRFPVFVKPKMSNRRIIAQSGAFIVYGTRELNSKNLDNDLAVKRFVIRKSSKENIRKDLAILGYHSSSLFPELDKAANYIATKYTV